jgi:hypothetical protein
MTADPFFRAETIRNPVRLSIPLELTRCEAQELAKFLQRLSFAELQTKACNDTEAYALLVTAERVRAALHEARFIPRLRGR